MRVEIFSDKFATGGNPSGRAVVDTEDPKVRELLGAKVVAELEGRPGGGKRRGSKAGRKRR